MKKSAQQKLAQYFLELHTDSCDWPLVLPNAWDSASALIFELAGFDTVGTSSAGIAASLGYPDGEWLNRRQMISAIHRITKCVQIPVSADLEAGYGSNHEQVAETVSAVIEAGAVGINLEDGTGEENNSIVDMDSHVEKIHIAREVAKQEDIPLVINGRTDLFWLEIGSEATRVERAIKRANAYLEAGSDCVFIPGVKDPDTIATLTADIDGPVNVLGGPETPSITALEKLGVARVSIGSGPMRASLGHLQEICKEIREDGTFGGMTDAIPYGELHTLLANSIDRRTE